MAEELLAIARLAFLKHGDSGHNSIKGAINLSGDGGVFEQMTDAEPAPSCAARFQVKVRRCNQVIMLNLLPLCFLWASFIALKSTLSYSIYCILFKAIMSL